MIRSRTTTHMAAAQEAGRCRRDARAAARRGGARAGRRDQLEHDLPEEQDERARDVEAVGEERAVAGVRLLLGLDPADGEDHLVGLAREQVAAARPAVDEQPDAGRVAALDLGAVAGRGAGDQRPRLLLDPAERRDVVVRAEQDPRLAGAGLRRQIGLPLGEPVPSVGQPARHRSARCRRASPGAAPAARARRSRGT